MNADHDRPTASPPSAHTGGLGECAGDTIGPYRLLELIGEGGFGVVWLAEQRGEFVRRVAMKVIKAGMDSRSVIERFEAERRILALMDHPNIARIIDAGTTPARMGSRPYFVMDYVAGEPITEYCDRRRLSIRQRLELIITVCGAVQHAHSKGVIHRDLKPTNILVAEVQGANPTGGVEGAVPMIIDFGVAKALGLAMNSATMYTERGVLIGTPEYMSPEQAEGDPALDARTDVYSLGVVLYELLSGALPFDRATLRSAALEEVRRIIREVDPPRPSTKLTGLGLGSQEIARKRHTDREALIQELRHELEWVPLRAMRKDKSERYGSPADMARDVRDYLDGKNLDQKTAPPGFGYALRKASQRHPAWSACFAMLASVAVAWMLARPAVTRWTPLDEDFQYYLYAHLRPPPLETLDDVRIIGITDRTNAEALGKAAGLSAVTDSNVPSLRRLHAALLRRLGASGCTVVAFDIFMRKETEFDKDLADAARSLSAEHHIDTVIALPSWSLGESGAPELSPALLPAVHWGGPASGGPHPPYLWREEVLATRGADSPIPGVSLAALASHWSSGGRAVITPHPERVDLDLVESDAASWAKSRTRLSRSLPLTSFARYDPKDAENDEHFGLTPEHSVGVAMTPLPRDALFNNATVEYSDAMSAEPARLREWFNGKIVLIANLRTNKDTIALKDRTIFGVWTHAAAIQAMLVGRVPARAPAYREFAAVVLAGIIGLFAGRLAETSRVGTIASLAVIPLGIAAVSAALYSHSATVWNPLTAIAAFALATTAVWLLRMFRSAAL